MSPATSAAMPGAPDGGDPFYRIAQSVAGEIGTEFLASLVRSMREAMDVSVAVITRGIGEPPSRARASFSWRKQGEDFPDEYELEGTPCSLVYQGQSLIVPEQLWQRFPRDDGFEGYCGVPLRDTGGKVIGHFSVLSETPIGNPEQTEGVLRIFGQRVQAELQRLEHEREREALVLRLSQALDRIGAQHRLTKEANAFKTATLGMVAHDLRNPLAAIVTRAEMIETLAGDPGGPAPPAADRKWERMRDAAQAITRTADRMERMIADLLTSAHSEAKSIALTRRRVELADPVRVAVGLNHAAAERKGVRITERLDAGIAVSADEDRLVEAVDNLLSNAVKFSAPGGAITVEIALLPRGDAAEIRVGDQGAGLTADDLARAFQPFQPLSATPTGGESSTGLGLAIVKAIAEAHGGAVTAASPGRGQGSTFVLRLPVEGPPAKGS